MNKMIMRGVGTWTPIVMAIVVAIQAVVFEPDLGFVMQWIAAMCWSVHVGRFLRRRSAGLDAQIFVVCIRNDSSDDTEIYTVEHLAVWIVPALAAMTMAYPWIK